MNVIPCHLFSVCFVPMNMNMNSRKVAISNNIRSVIMFGTCSGAMSAVIPITKKMLNMFEPTTFPTARSISFFLAAIMLVISSGSEVPTAIIVAEMTYSLIPICWAI